MIIATFALGGPILLMLVLIFQELKLMNDRAEGKKDPGQTSKHP